MKASRLSLRGLRVQIVLWVILPFVLVLIAFSLTGIRSHQQSMRELVAERDLGLVRALAHDVSNTLDNQRIALSLLVQTTEIGPETDLDALAAMLSRSLDMPFSLMLVDAQGHVLNASAGAIEEEDIYKGSIGVANPQILRTSDASFLVWTFSLSSSVYLLVSTPLRALSLENILDRGYPGRVGQVLVLDEAGRILALSGTSPADVTIPREVVYQTDSGVTYIPSSKGELVLAHARIPDISWYVLILEPWEALAAPLLHFDRVMPFILLFATVISILALVFGLRYVVGPLQRLREQAERIGEGDFRAAHVPVGGVQEIEELRQTLDRMAQQVANYQAALQMYLKMLTRIQEEERSRLARELHDSTIQALIALGQWLQMVQRELHRDPAQAAERLKTLRAMVGETINEVRRFTRALRPLYLEELGLIPTLEMLAREAGATFQVEGDPVPLPKDMELALFRIAQEALNNAQRHAQAQHVAIRLLFNTGRVHLIVQDDGRGFLLPQRWAELVQGGHLGLMSMRERAEIIGGRFILQSHPGRGTRVEVVAPLQAG